MLNDLLSGQVVASMDAAATSWPHVQKGTLRALGVSTAQRAFFAPDLAPIAESLPGFDVKPWHGVMAPAGTPQPIVDRLSQEIQSFIAQPATQAKLRERGVVPVGSSARDFAQAMMDLGATICTPRSPRCLLCPLADDCAARGEGRAEAYPVKAKKKVRPTRYGTMFWAERNGAVLLVRRPAKGLLAQPKPKPSTVER
jgi:hypothetical protein